MAKLARGLGVVNSRDVAAMPPERGLLGYKQRSMRRHPYVRRFRYTRLSVGDPTSLPMRRAYRPNSPPWVPQTRRKSNGTLRAEGLPVAPEERRLGQRRQKAALLAEPDRDRRPVADVRERVAVDEHRHVNVQRLIPDLEVDAARDDDRACVQRMRSDEGDHHCVQAARQHGTAVREVVRRRARWAGANHAVATLHAHVLASERPRELHHATLDRAQHDDVVDRRAADAGDIDLQRREVDDAVVAGEDPRKAGLELVPWNRGEESDSTEVHADDGDLAAEKPLERAQHRAIAAEDNGYIGIREIVLGLAHAMLFHLLVGKEQFDTRLARDFLQPLERRANGLGLPVRDDGSAPHGLS